MDNEYIFEAVINYQYSFSIFSEDKKLSDGEKFAAIYKGILAKYPQSIVYSETNIKNEPVFADLNNVQSFLYAGGLPFECQRILIKGLNLTLADGVVRETAVLLSVFPKQNTAQLVLSFSVPKATTDQLIYLRQIFVGTAEFKSSGVVSKPLKGWSKEIFEAMNCNVGVPEHSYLIEIKSFAPYENLDDILSNEAQRLYGIICGDEGWQFVPKEMAEERLSKQWGSRDFVKFITFGTNAMLINLNRSKGFNEYIEPQRQFGEHTGYGINPYFLLDASVAGVNHGVFLSMEMVLVIKTMINSMLDKQTGLTKGVKYNLGKSIRATKKYRSELMHTLNQIETISITELGEMEQMLVESYKIGEMIEDMKYLLELAESDLDLLYQQNTNRLVNLLTILGLLLSVLGVIIELWPS